MAVNEPSPEGAARGPRFISSLEIPPIGAVLTQKGPSKPTTLMSTIELEHNIRMLIVCQGVLLLSHQCKPD